MNFESLTGLVVGAGSIGSRHAKNLREMGVRVTASDPDSSALETLSAKVPVTTYESSADAFDAESPDFAVIATPSNSHLELALEAARHDCHLLIEKPLSDEVRGVETLESLVDERDLTTLVACNLRFLPEIRKVRSLVREGIVGDLIAVRIEGGSYLPEWYPDADYRESYSAREDLGGGVILDYIHEINYCRWVAGEIETVTAMAGQRSSLDIETNDVAGLIGETRDGTLCEIHMDFLQRPYSRSCHVIGENGTIRWSWEEKRVDWYVADEDTSHTFDRPRGWETNDMYLDEVEHFLTAIKEHSGTTCPLKCGVRDLRVALAARKSARKGRHVSV